MGVGGNRVQAGECKGYAIFSQPPGPTLLSLVEVPLVPSHSVPSAGPALSLCSSRQGSWWVRGGTLGLVLPGRPGQLDRQRLAWSSITRCWTVGKTVGEGVGYHSSCPQGLDPSWQRSTAHPHTSRLLHPTRHKEPTEQDQR